MEKGKRPIFLIASHLLEYPDRTWRQSLREWHDETAHIVNRSAQKTRFHSFVRYALTTPGDELESRYVETFDFGKHTNLYLTHALYAEERERGLALAKLKRDYARAGFDMRDRELPDYLPLMLEFVAVASLRDVKQLLSPFKPAIQRIHHELKNQSSPYAGVIGACLSEMERLGMMNGDRANAGGGL